MSNKHISIFVSIGEHLVNKVSRHWS